MLCGNPWLRSVSTHIREKVNIPLEEEVEGAEPIERKAELDTQKGQNSTPKEVTDNTPQQQQTRMEIRGVKQAHGLEGSKLDK